MTTTLTITNADVVINVVEINDRHGVGILLRRIFKDRSRTISIRTLNIYGGEQSFAAADLLLGRGLSRAEIFGKIEQAFSEHTIHRILCIPYHVEEILAALAVRELSGAEICTYLMDDRNVLINGIPDAIVSELLAQSSLCLAISPEMRDVYRAKYAVPIYFVPPVIPAALVEHHHPVALDLEQKKVGAILGNIWSPQWLQLLRTMTKEAGVQLDWYGNTGADWHFSDREKLSHDGITERGFLPTEADVVAVLRTYAYVVVPSGTLDLRDDNPATSWLSLPSRIPFILATANTPIIVLGNPSTAAARFVTRLGIGTVADYDPVSFRAAVAYITQASEQLRMRENAARIAPQFVNEQMDEWIWQSLALGKPIDDRFESLFVDAPEYTTVFTTCLDIIRAQKAEINQLKARSRLISPIEYLKEIHQYWKRLLTIGLRVKRKIQSFSKNN
jgi:hypothetical protein